MRTQGFGALAPQPVGPSSQLGKEQTLADAEDLFSRYGVWIRSIRQCAFTQERAQSVLNCLNTFKNRTAAPLKQFQRLLGHMAAAAAVTPLGLLHMRLLQHWLHGRVPRWTLRVQVTPACHQTLTPWSDLSFLRAGVPLEQVSRYAVVYTDASTKGWGATLNGLAVSGVWMGPQLHWNIKQLPRVAGSTPGLEPSQETLTRRARTGPRGQHCDRCVHQPTRWSTLPSHVATRPPPPPPLESEASEVASRHSYSGLAQPDSRRAVTSCAPRRMETPSPDGPADLATFWTRTGRPVHVPRDVALPVVLLPDRRNTRHGCTGTQLAAGHSQVCISPSEPSRTGAVQGQGGRGADPARGAILAHPDLVPRADAPRDSPSLADSSEEGSTASETGHPVAPASRSLGTSCLVPGRDAEVLGDIPQEGVYTITSARTVYETRLRLEVEPVRRMVLFSQRRPQEVPDQSHTVLFAATVRAKAVSLHP